MSTPVKFTPISEQPHISAMMRCDACEHVAVHVYPASTPQRLLHCQCGEIGRLVVMRESSVMETEAAIDTAKTAASGLSPESEAAVLMPYYKCLQLLHSRDREIGRLNTQLDEARDMVVKMVDREQNLLTEIEQWKRWAENRARRDDPSSKLVVLLDATSPEPSR